MQGGVLVKGILSMSRRLSSAVLCECVYLCVCECVLIQLLWNGVELFSGIWMQRCSEDKPTSFPWEHRLKKHTHTHTTKQQDRIRCGQVNTYTHFFQISPQKWAIIEFLTIALAVILRRCGVVVSLCVTHAQPWILNSNIRVYINQQQFEKQSHSEKRRSGVTLSPSP